MPRTCTHCTTNRPRYCHNCTIRTLSPTPRHTITRGTEATQPAHTTTHPGTPGKPHNPTRVGANPDRPATRGLLTQARLVCVSPPNFPALSGVCERSCVCGGFGGCVKKVVVLVSQKVCLTAVYIVRGFRLPSRRRGVDQRRRVQVCFSPV